jgi:hypothetical protein
MPLSPDVITSLHGTCGTLPTSGHFVESVLSMPLKTTEKFTLPLPNFLQEEKSMDNSLPHDAVERVRAIRDRHYEETKHMTREEKRAYDDQRRAKSVAEFKQLMKDSKPDYDRFPFLAGK